MRAPQSLHLGPADVPLPARAAAHGASDGELLARLCDGDVAALDDVLLRYWGPVVAYVARLCGARDAAEDIAQRTFCRLWERRASWGAQGSLRGLLYRVARNLAVSEYRRGDAESRRVVALGEGSRPNPTPLELLEEQQLRRELERAIQELPPRRREVFVLRCIHELSYREIADVMDTSTQTVANQLSSALATLRLRLAHLLDG